MEINAAIEQFYASLQPASRHAAPQAEPFGMEFISSTAQERNVQAMREMQTDLQ
jgi:hypothetical protein